MTDTGSPIAPVPTRSYVMYPPAPSPAQHVSLPAGAYAGLDRFVARQQLWKDMEAAGLVIKKEDYTTRCGIMS
jgi:valyl-tRNA synthetase